MTKTDHWCAVFDDRHQFLERGVEFLDEGGRGGLQLWYVADRDEAAMADELAPLGDVEGLVRAGRLVLTSAGSAYSGDAPVDPLRQVEAYRTATTRAIEAGHRGLRVLADVTPLVRTPAQLSQFLRYEHLVDHLMAGEPFSAMCGYDRTQLPAATVEKLAALHPHVAGHDCEFNLYAGHDVWAVLDGECDTSTQALLAALCETVWPDGRIDLDLHATRFIDHRSLLALDSVACARSGTVRLRNASALVHQLVDLLDLGATELVPR